jgi:hypothetical protein
MARRVFINIILLSLVLFTAVASAEQTFSPKQGLYYAKEIGDVKFHVYTSPLAAGASASVVIETKNSLILQDVQQNKSQMDELKNLIQSIDKPLRRIYISHDHSHHWAGLELLPEIPVYANQETIDFIKQKGEAELQALKKQFGSEAVPYSKIIVPENVVEVGSEEVIDGLRIIFNSPAPQLTGPVLFMEFPQQKIMIAHHLAYAGVHVPLPPVEGRLAKLNEMKDKEWAWVIGGHGIPVSGPEYFSKTIDYYTTLGKVVKESPDVATAKDKMIKAYPTYGGVILLDILLPSFYQSATVESDELYVNPSRGDDLNSGAKDSPIRTLAEAARRVNQSEGTGPMTVILSEGVYAVAETAMFKPERRAFTTSNRLTIRAEVLPDDPDWHTGRMPTLIHTLPLGGRGLIFGMLIETSHVTIRGIKLLGAPVVETPKPGMLVRVYPIGRMSRQLDDLEIAQCLFAGDKVTNPNHLGILTNGSGVHVHHCVFYNAKLTVVFWTGGSSGHSMHNCFVYGAYGSGVWTTEISDDLDFHNNVIANGNYVWTYQSGRMARRDPDAGSQRSGSAIAPEEQRVHYKVVDSLFAGNKRIACTGTGAYLGFEDIDSSFLELVNTKISDQPVAIELDETKRNYLHPVEGSEAAKIGVGLFTKGEN